ncbi:phosphoesterase [Halobacteriales archaeon QH_7_69_31]|nr:MAG: phosphoesterase [Halobacteriales archaeon QH_7_69_31]
MPDGLARELGRKSATTSARNTVVTVLLLAIVGAILLGIIELDPLLVAAVVLLVVVIAAVTSAVEIVEAYERRALTVLGDYRRLLDPGVHLVPPFVTRTHRFDLRTQTFDVPRQEAITRDNSPVTADAVVYIRVMDAKRAFLEVEDYQRAVSNLAQTTLRAAIGDMELDATLSDRSRINEKIRKELEGPTDEWGIRVEAVEVREVNPSTAVQSAMEQQTAAERRRRAMILEAQGERRSAIERARGDKQANILESQGEKQSQILEAQGEAISTVLRAKSAESMGERAVVERGMDALADIGTSPSTTYVLPQELTSLLGRHGRQLTGSDAAGGEASLESLAFDAETRELLGIEQIEELAAGDGDATAADGAESDQ